MNKYEVWHTRIIGFGIILNMFFIFALVFFPAWILGFLKIPLDQLIGAHASGILLFLLLLVTREEKKRGTPVSLR